MRNVLFKPKSKSKKKFYFYYTLFIIILCVEFVFIMVNTKKNFIERRLISGCYTSILPVSKQLKCALPLRYILRGIRCSASYIYLSRFGTGINSEILCHKHLCLVGQDNLLVDTLEHYLLQSQNLSCRRILPMSSNIYMSVLKILSPAKRRSNISGLASHGLSSISDLPKPLVC